MEMTVKVSSEEAMEGGDDSECETDARRWVLLSWTEVLHYD